MYFIDAQFNSLCRCLHIVSFVCYSLYLTSKRILHSWSAYHFYLTFYLAKVWLSFSSIISIEDSGNNFHRFVLLNYWFKDKDVYFRLKSYDRDNISVDLLKNLFIKKLSSIQMANLIKCCTILWNYCSKWVTLNCFCYFARKMCLKYKLYTDCYLNVAKFCV